MRLLASRINELRSSSPDVRAGRALGGQRIVARLPGRVGEAVALRLPDPLGRRDAAGRVIPHDFVVFGDAATGVESVEGGLKQVGPRVAAACARVWDAGRPPSAAELFTA